MAKPALPQMIKYLQRASQLAIQAQALGHHPFGELLLGPDLDTTLIEQGNIDAVNHAESSLIRAAAARFSTDYLWECTLYTTVEPCAMCAATQYWANIGSVVYGISESRLLSLTGNHPENPTLDLPCRTVFSHGQKDITVYGPIAEVEAEIAAVHKAFWQLS